MKGGGGYGDPPCCDNVYFQMNLLRSSLSTVGSWEICSATRAPISDRDSISNHYSNIVYPPVRGVHKWPDYLWKGSTEDVMV